MAEGEQVTVELPVGWFTGEQLVYFGVMSVDDYATVGDVLVIRGDGSGTIKLTKLEGDAS